MATIVWEQAEVGVVQAWYREDRTELRCLLRIETVAWPHAFRVSAERPGEAAFPPLVLTLRHSEFDLARAKYLAELLEAEYPVPLHDERALGELFEQHRQELAQRDAPRQLRCEFVHAWAPGARSSEPCLCGRITKRYARERRKKVPA